MGKEKTVVVTGATGFIGRSVMALLRERGWKAIVVSTNPAAARQMYPEALSCIGLEGRALEDAVVAHGKVIRLSGVNPLLKRWTTSYKAKIWDSRVGTARRAAEAMAVSKAEGRVIVSAGGINIHPDMGDRMVTPDSPMDTTWVATMLAAKEAALQPAVTSGARAVTLRIGIAFGSSGGPLAFIAQNFAKGMGGHIGSGRQFVPWLHVDDLARMFVTALENSAWNGPFIAAAPHSVRARDLSIAIGQNLGRASWFHLPTPLARIILGEVAGLVVTSYRADPSKAERLGFVFAYPGLETAFLEIYAASGTAVRRQPLAAVGADN